MDLVEQSLEEIDVSESLLLGIGGAGCNIVERIQGRDTGISETLVVDTDLRTLHASSVATKIQIGKTTTRGLSTGNDIELGKKAIKEQLDSFKGIFSKKQLVFLVCGLGGGTASAACSKIAEIASDEGAIVVALVVKPFALEGDRKKRAADDAVFDLSQSCHAVISLANDDLTQELDKSESYLKVLSASDEWVLTIIDALSSMFLKQGNTNVDRATLESAFSIRGGKTLFSFGRGEGVEASAEALNALEQCPLLHLPENNYHRQTDTLIVHVASGPDFSKGEMDLILAEVNNRFSSKESTVVSVKIDEYLSDSVEVTVIGSSVNRAQRRNSSSRSFEPAVRVPAAHGLSSQKAKELEKNNRRKKNLDANGQKVFNFPKEEDSRGIFEKTETNMYEGIDLDIPTFIRNKIKVNF